MRQSYSQDHTTTGTLGEEEELKLTRGSQEGIHHIPGSSCSCLPEGMLSIFGDLSNGRVNFIDPKADMAWNRDGIDDRGSVV